MVRGAIRLLVGVCLVVMAGACRAQVTLYRDRFGVPSIVASTLPDGFYGLGYAMAQDNAERMARNYKQARGRLSEVEGKGDLLMDGFIRSLGIETLAEQKARTLQGEPLRLLQSFCAGANRAIVEQKGRLPDWIEPFTLVDVLALMQLGNIAFPLQEIADTLAPGTGSNQFALAPKRTRNGHVLLSTDPHLDLYGAFLMYEFGLYTKEVQFRGITQSGLPIGLIGHTAKVAWCMTNNDPRLYDFFTVKTNPDNPKQYRYHGEWRDFEDVPMELRYREEGVLKTRRQTVRRTAWGPMIPFRSYAVALAPLGAWDALEQEWQMLRARNAKEFRTALQRRGRSMWNLVYADTAGNIGYQYNARVPRRDEALDWTKPVDGSDPKTKWGPLWPLDALPHAENPKSGVLVNANSAPWLTTLGSEITPKAWPAYITTYGHTTRYDRLAALLAPAQHVTAEKAQQFATDTEVPYALKAVAQLKQAAAGKGGLIAQAMDVLAAWNGRADVDAKGCGLYYYWLRADSQCLPLSKKAGTGKGWTEGEAALAAEALGRAAETLQNQHGAIDLAWGKIHVLRRGAKTVPMSGFRFVGRNTAQDPYENYVVSVVPNGGAFRDGVMDCTFGSSFRMVVELDPKGVRSWSILPFGNAQNPANPHYTDQMERYGRGEYKDTLFGIARVKRLAVSKQNLRRP